MALRHGYGPNARTSRQATELIGIRLLGLRL